MTLLPRSFLLFTFSLLLVGCETAYYNTMENFGVHKRDILVDRVGEARESQVDGQQQFKDALEQFKSVVNYDGGKLEAQYNKLNGAYEDSVEASEEITDRVNAVESVANALFKEWEKELDQYTSASLRQNSANQLRDTKRSYATLISKMRKAEQSVAPVLNVLKDNVLYLKHNLNARAIGALKGELSSVDRNVQQLIAAMEASIRESDEFIKGLK